MKSLHAFFFSFEKKDPINSGCVVWLGFLPYFIFIIIGLWFFSAISATIAGLTENISDYVLDCECVCVPSNSK